MDLDSRVAIVGPNGAGKSTLLKLMTGDLEALDGMVKRHNHLKLGMYHQHLTELLDPQLTPLEYMVSLRPSCQRQACPEGAVPGQRPAGSGKLAITYLWADALLRGIVSVPMVRFPAGYA